MRWGAGSLRWVRPLHSILCILSDEAGAEIVPMDIDGIKAGNTTQGHRFMSPGQITVNHFEGYSSALKKAFVVLDAAERAEHIWADATNMAFAQGLEVVEDKGLLAEVSGLVEWPVVLMGDIGEDFLGLPPEVLQTSMKEHQKFFSVRNPKTGRIEKFITVANRETSDQGTTILAGNQKVLAARLADAKFFWENDLRTVEREGMKAWTDSLSNVTFHASLGSQGERIDRIAALARKIAPFVGASADEAELAARVAKADLASEMVYEFPELQGVMGQYYSKSASLSDAIAAACVEHWQPLGPSDDVPTAPVSVVVALADKIDTLTGFWAIDEKPTGSKDPYALRRAALGVIRLVLENGVRASLTLTLGTQISAHIGSQLGHALGKKTVDAALALESIGQIQLAKTLVERLSDQENISFDLIADFSADLAIGEVGPNLLSFFHDRLKVYLRDRGIRHDVIDACLAMPGNDDLTLLVNRATALSDFLKTDDGTNLLQGFKRANNILTQAETADGVEYSYGAEQKFAEGAEESALFDALAAQGPGISNAIAAEDFAGAMVGLAALRGPLDGFFDAVQVNSDNQVLRRNRLNLLSEIRSLCLAVADLTAIEG
jgi:glycyl-tRNA synthetase beta chain